MESVFLLILLILNVKMFNVSNSTSQKPNASYYSVSDLEKLVSSLNKTSLSLFHFNARSLGKNLDKIEEFFSLLNYSPAIIAVSETKINFNSVRNVCLPSYSLLTHNSKTQAGGVGLYTHNSLQATKNTDFDLDLPGCEDLWVEINQQRNKKLIVGLIYRHPTHDFKNFQKRLLSTIFTLENNKYDYIICGDFNIDILKADVKPKVNEYLSSLNAAGCQILIDKPTRFSNNCNSSLLDHIYTNISDSIKNSGVCQYYNISDHFPTFLTIEKFLNPSYKQRKFVRSTKHFQLDDFLTDLNARFSSESFSDSSDVNLNIKKFFVIFKDVLDHHAPLKRLSRREAKISSKPWISKGILNSIRTKNKLYKSLCKDKFINLFCCIIIIIINLFIN